MKSSSHYGAHNNVLLEFYHSNPWLVMNPWLSRNQEVSFYFGWSALKRGWLLLFCLEKGCDTRECKHITFRIVLSTSYGKHVYNVGFTPTPILAVESAFLLPKRLPASSSVSGGMVCFEREPSRRRLVGVATEVFGHAWVRTHGASRKMISLTAANGQDENDNDDEKSCLRYFRGTISTETLWSRPRQLCTRLHGGH